MTDLIFLDTETTGLDYGKHEIWEVALAVNDGPISTHIVVHSLKTADPTALDLNGYFRRHAGAVPRSDGPWVDLDIRRILAGNTLVCANPTFDRIFMYLRWGLEPYHYRSIDVETMALTVFEWERPRGLKDVANELRSRKYDIPEPDHTAGKDVEVLRACYDALRSENNKYKIYRGDMMQIDIPIRIRLGSEPTVQDLREATEKLKRVPDGAAVRFEIDRGQRDQENVTLVVQGAALLEP